MLKSSCSQALSSTGQSHTVYCAHYSKWKPDFPSKSNLSVLILNCSYSPVQFNFVIIIFKKLSSFSSLWFGVLGHYTIWRSMYVKMQAQSALITSPLSSSTLWEDAGALTFTLGFDSSFSSSLISLLSGLFCSSSASCKGEDMDVSDSSQNTIRFTVSRLTLVCSVPLLSRASG